jgi:cell division protein FtsZ
MSKYIEETNKELEAVLGSHKTQIRIVGTGGAGNNTVTRLLEVGIKGVEAIAINTDAQDLLFSKANKKVLIGKTITNGLGAGSDPKAGAESAKESIEEIEKVLSGSDMVFVTCGLGGGTGTGSAPIIAEIVKNSGALTIAVVTLPFTEEGVIRWSNASKGLEKLYKHVDTVIVVQNDRLLEIVPDLPLSDAFKVADEILVNAVKGITELVTEKGLVNLDFADIRAIMQNGGMAMIGLGESGSEESAKEAAEKALKNPLLDVDVTGAKNALINITGGRDMTLKSAKTVMKTISERLDPSAKIIWGARLDESMDHTLRVMLIVTCLKATKRSATEIDLAIKQPESSQESEQEVSPEIPSEIAEPPPEPESTSKKEPVPAPAKSTERPTKKRGSKVFTEIFLDESRADLSVLQEAVRGLTVGNRSKNEKYFRDIKNACYSLHNSAELFAFNSIAEFAQITGHVAERALNGEFDLSENFLSLFSRIPSTLENLIADNENAYSDAEEVKQSFNNILKLLNPTDKDGVALSDRDNKEFAEGNEQGRAPGEAKVGEETDEGQVGGNDSENEESLKAEESAEVEPSNNKQNFTTVNEAVKFVEKLF